MVRRKAFQTARAIRAMLSKTGFRGGWIEAIHRKGDTLLIQVHDDQERPHRFCFGNVLAARGLKKGVRFVHGAFVDSSPSLNDHHSAQVTDPGHRPFQFSLIREEALVEVTAQALWIDSPGEYSMPLGSARSVSLGRAIFGRQTGPGGKSS